MVRELLNIEPELKLFKHYAIEVDIHWKEDYGGGIDTYILGYFKLETVWYISLFSREDNNRLFEPVAIGQDGSGDCILGHINLYPILIREMKLARSQATKINIFKVTKW